MHGKSILYTAVYVEFTLNMLSVSYWSNNVNIKTYFRTPNVNQVDNVHVLSQVQEDYSNLRFVNYPNVYKT